MSNLKLNIGCGDTELPGYLNIDRKTGGEAYPLKGRDGYIEDGAADEIRASHILEHFSHHEIINVLDDWVRALKPGGRLRIAVPNLEWIASEYLAGRDAPFQSYLMGGQADDDDYHKTVFDDESLREVMVEAGLVDISPWENTTGDCASLPVSLNLQGRKPIEAKGVAVIDGPPGGLKIAGCMSVPRLGFMDNFFCAFQALLPLKISLRKFEGAFWGQCLERSMEEAIENESPDIILTIDYDTVFQRSDVIRMAQIMADHPEIDALAPIQSGRGRNLPLLTLDLPEGVDPERVPLETFSGDFTKIRTAHFGLTMIRVSSLKKLSRPWLYGKPGPAGKWDDGRIDDDTAFWNKWEAEGYTLYSANRVPVGHLQLMVTWPGADFGAVMQHTKDYQKNGKDKDAWK